MIDISYAAAPVPIRQDLPAAHRRAWQRLPRAGNWWTGAERVAMAAEVRSAWQCPLCKARKAALSPYTIEGTHDSVSKLPASAIDVIHRVVTDPGRLTQHWFAKTMGSQEITDGQYVEIIDVIVTVVSIDSFCRGVGAALHPLPQPERGGSAMSSAPSVWCLTRSGSSWISATPTIFRVNASWISHMADHCLAPRWS